MDPLAKGGRVQVEVCGDPRDAAVCNLAETHGLGLELRGEGAAWPLREGLCLFVHGALRASIVANFSVHESEASSIANTQPADSCAFKVFSRWTRG